MKYIQEPDRVPCLDVVSAHGIPFRVLADVRANLVEFWDTRSAAMHPILNIAMPGRFTGGCFRLNQILDAGGRSDLVFDEEVPAWRLDASSEYVVRVWLRHLRMRDASVSHAAEQEVI